MTQCQKDEESSDILPKHMIGHRLATTKSKETNSCNWEFSPDEKWL